MLVSIIQLCFITLSEKLSLHITDDTLETSCYFMRNSPDRFKGKASEEVAYLSVDKICSI